MSALSFSAFLLSLLLVFPLLALSKNKPANLWLAAYVSCLAGISFSAYIDASQLYLTLPRLWGWFELAFPLVGLSYYFYCRALMGLKARIHQLWHLLPFTALFLFITLIHLSLDSTSLREAIIQDAQQDSGDGFWTLAFQTQALAYLLASLWRLRQYQNHLKQQYSSVSARNLRWLFWLTLANVLMWLFWQLANSSQQGEAIQIGLRLCLCYALCWYGIKQASLFKSAPAQLDANWNTASAELFDTPQTQTAQSCPEQTRAEPEKKYVRSGLDESAAAMITTRLNRAMKELKLYRQPDLNLNQLADAIGATPAWLSQTINQNYNTNFFDYVNNFRVRELQVILSDPAQADANLLELALMAGFNSKSTFNHCFKKMTGQTPSAWRKQQQLKSDPMGTDELIP